MSVDATSDPRLRLPVILSTAFNSISRHWVGMGALGIVLIAAPALGHAFVERTTRVNALPLAWVYPAAAGYLQSMLIFFYYAWWGRIVWNDAHGNRDPACEISFISLLSVAGAALLVQIGFLLGFVLLIVPGLIFALASGVTAQAALAEGKGPVRALRRSFALTRNRRYVLLGLMLATSLPVFAMIMLGQELITNWSSLRAANGDFRVAFIWRPLVWIPTSMFLAACKGATYVTLRETFAETEN